MVHRCTNRIEPAVDHWNRSNRSSVETGNMIQEQLETAENHRLVPDDHGRRNQVQIAIASQANSEASQT